MMATSSYTTERLEAQIVALRFLSDIMREVPSDERLAFYCEQKAFDEFPLGKSSEHAAAGLTHLQTWQDAYPQQGSEPIRRDAMRLFLGPQRPLASPWESVHTSIDRLIFQETTLDVRRWYAIYNLESKMLNREPDDHIALEMEFLAVISEQLLASMLSDRSSECTRHEDNRRSFMQEHLGKWYGTWCDLVIENAETPFYKGIGHLIKATLDDVAAA